MPIRPRGGLNPFDLTRLTGVELQNFKSIKSARVNIKPLTIVAGANSAGKSSLLQSILALAQVSRRRIDGNTFPLNDELVRLGTFPALKRQQASIDEPLKISFSFESSLRPIARYLSPRSRLSRYSLQRDLLEMDETMAINWTIELDSQVDIQIGSAQISAIEISAEHPHLVCRVNRSANQTTEDNASRSSEETPAQYAGYCRRLLEENSGSHEESSTITVEDVRIVSGQLTAILVKPDPDERVRQWLEEASAYMDLFDLENFDSAEVEEQHFEVQELIDAIALAIQQDQSMQDNAEFVRQYSLYNSQTQTNIRSRVRDRLIEDGSESTPQVLDNDATEHIVGAQRICSRYLASGVKYVGPLRHAPHLPFGSSPDPDSGSVGIAGEHVAAILQARRGIRRRFPLPGGINKLLPLEEAVSEWLSFLELADSLSVHEGTPLVYGINLRPPGLDDSVPLSAVGVGVSQVLPIIVQCLVAGPGALILLEQPELHLHPAAQQRLADFLIACTNWGQRILVESHSEYLVLRLRRRIAEDVSDELRRQVAILFAERDKQGDTAFREVEMNEAGGVVEWPDGFFDQGQNEAHELLVAAAHRQRRIEEAAGKQS